MWQRPLVDLCSAQPGGCRWREKLRWASLLIAAWGGGRGGVFVDVN